MVADYSDQTDIFDPAKFAWPVHMIGLGGIGSATVLPLVKLGLRSTLHLWDNDEVEPRNIPAQLIYRPSDVGKSKVQATIDTLSGYIEAPTELQGHTEFVTATTDLSGVVISGVDSMSARNDIWQAVKWNPEVPLLLDGRIGGEQLTLLALSPSDPEAIEYYEELWLFPDEEGAELPCAARTVIHPVVVLAGCIVAQLTRFARGLPPTQYIDVHTKTTDVIVQPTPNFP